MKRNHVIRCVAVLLAAAVLAVSFALLSVAEPSAGATNEPMKALIAMKFMSDREAGGIVTRGEALKWVLKATDKTRAALAYEGECLYRDAVSDYQHYAGYATGVLLIPGVSDTWFGVNDATTLDQFLLFALHAMGQTDVTEDEVQEKAAACGLYTVSDADALHIRLTNEKMSCVLWNLLACQMPDSEITWADNWIGTKTAVRETYESLKSSMSYRYDKTFPVSSGAMETAQPVPETDDSEEGGWTDPWAP